MMNEITDLLMNDLAEIHKGSCLVQAKFEKRCCRLIAQRFFERGIPAFASVDYPENARENPAKPDECDLVISTGAAGWLWIEKKVIWKGVGAAAHYLRQEAVTDARKLDRLRRPEAAFAGLLMVGLDNTKRESARLERDVEGIYVEAAKVSAWKHAYRPLDPVEGYRVHVWFRWRPVDG